MEVAEVKSELNQRKSRTQVNSSACQSEYDVLNEKH